ncbi:MAG: hypothetical protein U0893_22600 [Chloroflexota bacterium]
MARAPRGLDLLLHKAGTAEAKYAILHDNGCLTRRGMNRRDAIVAGMEARLAPSGVRTYGATDDQHIMDDLAIGGYLSRRGLALMKLNYEQFQTWYEGGRGPVPRVDEHGRLIPPWPRRWWPIWWRRG